MNRRHVPQLRSAAVYTPRRNFLRGLVAWGGLVLTAACAAATASTPASTPPLPSSGDFQLDELRRLAVEAPLEELLAWRLVFLMELGGNYRNDPQLWRGVERLCQATLDGVPMPPARQSVGAGPDRRLFARLLAQVIERGEPVHSAPLQPRVAELRRIQ